MIRRSIVLSALVLAAVSGVVPAAHATPSSAGPITISNAVVTIYPASANPIPAGCVGNHPPYSDCGYGFVDFDVSGFDAYGGIPATCDPTTQDCVGGTLGRLDASWPARLTQVYTCGPGGPTNTAQSQVGLGVRWYSEGAAVDARSRVDSNTARLSAGVRFPNPHEYSVCPDVTVMVSGQLDQIAVGFTGSPGIPNAVYTDPRSFPVPLPGAPTTPTSVTVRANSTTDATLTWTSSKTASGSAVTGYRVGRDGVDSTGTGAWSTVVPADAVSLPFHLLVPARTYHFSVQAISATGTSPSGTSALRLPGATAPRTVSVVARPAVHRATLSWTPPATTQGYRITGYRVSRNGTDSSGTGAWSTTVAPGARSFTFAKLLSGQPYTLVVQAITAQGPGATASRVVSLR